VLARVPTSLRRRAAISRIATVSRAEILKTWIG